MQLQLLSKGKMSASRLKQKLAYLEQTYELESLVDSDVRYRLYRRHNPKNVQVFSVGLSVSVGGGGGTELDFTRFVELGSSTKWVKELKLDGATSKAWTTQDGKVREGKPINKGLIYKLLGNRTYLGELRHKELWCQAGVVGRTAAAG